ncbi:hypothetical protein JCM10450v2_005534 [Rhodotorula kratochvilovae]
MSIWTPAMFGFNGPTGCADTEGCIPGQEPVTPLKDLEFDDWWYRGPKYRSEMPDVKDVAVLPAGGTWTAEITCHKDFTSYGDKTTASGSPYECCPNSPGPYHSHDEANNLDESQLGGCALGIADVVRSPSTDPSDSSIDGDNQIVIFSVQAKCVWTRETTWSIPSNMPACSGEYCICSWHWIARQDLPNSYMTGFLCKIDGATSTAKWDDPQNAVWCAEDPSKCVTGARRPMYAYNNPNNVPEWDSTNPNAKRPGYNSDWGWKDGAQDDIFGGNGGSPSVKSTVSQGAAGSSSSVGSSTSGTRSAPTDTTAASKLSSTSGSRPSANASAGSTSSSASSSSSSSSGFTLSPLTIAASVAALLVVGGLVVCLVRMNGKKLPSAGPPEQEEEKALRKASRPRRRHGRTYHWDSSDSGSSA